MKLFFLVLITTVFFACNNAPRQNEASSGDSTISATGKTDAIGGEQCYLFVAVKDTYALKLDIAGAAVKGSAVFKNFEKDSNLGTVEGSIDGDIIHLWYNFQSEGMNSVRELYFKKEGDKLVTGISNEATRGDTAYVPDANAVKYEGPAYGKAACGLVPHL